MLEYRTERRKEMEGGLNPNVLIQDTLAKKHVPTSVRAQRGAMFIMATLPSQRQARFSAGAPNHKGYLLIGQVGFGIKPADVPEMTVHEFEARLAGLNENVHLEDGTFVWEIDRQVQLVSDIPRVAWRMYQRFVQNFCLVEQCFEETRAIAAA